eukprot:m.275784 g.275784  ORF g.275784 m.275784 type:complete len:1931 (+) comp40604_c0_seq9:2253-8045(+)
MEESRMQPSKSLFQFITQPPADVTINHGRSATLTCAAAGYPIPSITWSSPTGNTFTEKTPATPATLAGVVSSTIDILNAKGADGGGTFTCKASNGKGNDAMSQATVSVKTKITMLSPQSLTVKDGSSVSAVVCIAEGYPKPTVVWKQSGSGNPSQSNEYDVSRSTFTTGRNLTLGNVSFSQNGAVYSCETNNSAGSDTSVFTLTVTLDASFKASPQNAYGRVGDTLTLSCEAEGGSAKAIDWFKGNQMISSSLSQSSLIVNRVSSTLTLSNMRLTDGSDEYYCKAGPSSGHSNAVESNKATVGILGTITSFKDRAFNVGSNPSPFLCSFTANPQPSGEMKLDGQTVANLTQTTSSNNVWTIRYPISPVTIRKGGDYTCTGRMGPSVSISDTKQLGITVSFTEDPKPATLESGKIKTIRCAAQGYPIPTITWTRRVGGQSNSVQGKETNDAANRVKTSEVSLTGNSIDQAGSYQCSADNRWAQPAQQSNSAEVAVAPLIVSQSFTRNASWGSDEKLSCDVIGYPLPSIDWTFRGSVVSGAVQSSSGGTNQSSVITRTSVSASKDGGVYTCDGTNSAGSANPVAMTLEFDPRVTMDPISQEVVYGGKLTLACQVTSFPAVSSFISWHRGDQRLPTAIANDITNKDATGVTSTLTVSQVKETDGGEYTCYGSSKPAHITIGNQFVLNPVNNAPIEGTTVTLSCKVVGYPPGRIVWEKSSPNQDSFNILGLGGNVAAVIQNDTTSEMSDLTLTGIQRSDHGYYQCKATQIGNEVTSSPGYVDVYYIPSFTLDLSGSRSIDLGKSFSLSCTAAGNPSPIIVFYLTTSGSTPVTLKVKLDSNRTVSSDSNGKVTLTVTGAETSDSGQYFCQAVNQAGQVNSSTSTILVSGPPSRIDPSLVTSTSTTNSTITFKWTEPYDGNSPITNYTIRYKESGSSDNYKTDSTLDSLARTSTLSGLKPYTNYAILIIPANSNGPAQSTIPKNLKTAPGVPSSPKNLNVTVVNSTSLSAKWESPSEPNGEIRSYRVSYVKANRQERDTSTAFKDFNGKSVSGEISGLEKYTKYDLTVRAVNELNGKELIGPPSNSFQAMTAEDAPSKPLNVRVETIVNSTSTLGVSWNHPAEPNGIIRNYTISYWQRDSSAAVRNTFPVGGDKKNAIIRGLDPYTSYSVQVWGFTVKKGKESQEVEGKTDQGLPSAPLKLFLIENGSTSVTLQWQDPAIPRGVVTKYVVYYQGSKSYSGEGNKQETVNVDLNKPFDPRTDNQYVVDRLVPDTVWTFSVAASTIKGKGTSSTSVTGKTMPDKPVEVEIPTADTSRAAKTTVVINLVKPSEKNGKIGQIDLLVAPLASETESINFDTFSENTQYSDNQLAGTIYVAARFQSRQDFPTEFILGDGREYGGFTNGPLKAGTTYAYALRVSSASDNNLVTVSDPLKISTKGGNNLGLIIGIAVGIVVLIVIVVIIVVIFAVRKGKQSNKESYSPTVQYFSGDEGEIEVVESVKPTLAVTQANFTGVAGESVVLEIQVSGKPDPVVAWRFNGVELPSDDLRIKILDSGSLMIENVRESDAGLYKCSATSKVGSSYGQVKLRLDAVYANTAFRKEAIPEGRFESYTNELHANHNHGFSLEYPLLDKPEKHPFTVAKKEVNRGKNRYANIVPYDHSRVALEPLSGVLGSDYINASYLDGYQCAKGYIAAQGPNDKTLNDFWRMIWQEKVPTIVMVTNLEEKGKSKCVQYWPDAGTKECGKLRVTLRQELSLSECTVRILDISEHNPDGTVSTHSTTQFHFTNWPDHGVPAYATSLLNFLKRARIHHNKLKNKGPMLVHCSAGVGRTGTFLVIDYSFQKLKKEKVIDIFNLLNDLRDGRPSMVQTEAQYIFCHNAILEYVLCGDTDVQAHNVRNYVRQLENVDPVSKKTGMQKQLDLLKKNESAKECVFFQGRQ